MAESAHESMSSQSTNTQSTNTTSASSSSGSVAKPRARTDRLTVVTLYVAGIYFLVVPVLLPDLLGWTLLEDRFGATKILCLVVGFQFLYIALLTRDKARTRQLTLDTLEALNQFVYGVDYRRDREVVELLIRGLGTSDASARRHAVEKLESMTGQSFGTDAARWAEWWAKHRSRFRARGAGASGEGMASAIDPNAAKGAGS